jgi:hypothetical protein
MKTAEIIDSAFLLSVVFACAFFRSGLGNRDRRTCTKFQGAINNDRLTVFKSLVDEPFIVVPVSNAHRTEFSLALLVNDPDKAAPGTLLNRALRDKDRIRSQRTFQSDANELSRP